MSRIALQLYTVRDLCAEDLAGALASTAALGFEGVELHDLYGHPADAVRRLLDETGLVACFLELDLGWVWYAGSDPFALLDRAGEQAPLVHVKDMKKDGGPGARSARRR